MVYKSYKKGYFGVPIYSLGDYVGNLNGETEAQRYTYSKFKFGWYVKYEFVNKIKLLVYNGL